MRISPLLRDAVRREYARRARAVRNSPLDRYRADPAQLMVDAGYPPDPWQAELLRANDRQILILATRQCGKTLTAGFLIIRQALLRPHSTILIVAPSERQSKELLTAKVKPALARLNRPVPVLSESALQIRFANGSRVIALPGDEKTVRVYTADMIVVDEAARVLDPLYFAVRPMLATTGGTLVCLTSAFAKSGFFYDEWMANDPGFTRVRVPATLCPRISPEFLANERRSLGERWFAMEYLTEFGDDLAAVFRMEDIQAALDPTVRSLFDVPVSDAIMRGTLDPTVRRLFA